MPRTTEIEEAKGFLRRAVVATITGTRPEVAVNAVSDALCALFNLVPDAFSIHLYHPEDFIIIFRPKLHLAHPSLVQGGARWRRQAGLPHRG